MLINDKNTGKLMGTAGKLVRLACEKAIFTKGFTLLGINKRKFFQYFNK